METNLIGNGIEDTDYRNGELVMFESSQQFVIIFAWNEDARNRLNTSSACSWPTARRVLP